MKICVLQNSQHVGLGILEHVLRNKFNCSFTVVSARADEWCPENLFDHDLFIILGSTSSVYELGSSWIEGELNFVKKLIDRRRPVFGICFGAQLIAAALDARVFPLRERHYGWKTNDYAISELWSGPWFRWHGDTFELPVGAQLLASSEGIPQAFQAGSAVGVQFHPEVGSDCIAAWTNHFACDLEKDGVDSRALVLSSQAHAASAKARLALLFDDIVSRCMALVS